MKHTANRPRPQGGIETRSIDYVPEHERHGKVKDQGPFWFLGNFQFFTIAIGFIGPGMGLSLGYTALGGILGILFGTLFMAFHASQGAEMGLPQMIQSRAQFGYRGVSLVLIGTLFTFVGFNVVDTVLVADGLHNIFKWNPVAIALIMAAAGTFLAIYGHDWLHRIFKLCFVISLPLYAILTIAIVLGKAGGHAPAATLGFSWTAFIAQFAASASYNITYAPYVSDYSRYLPRKTRMVSIVSAVFFGASSSAIWLIAVGAWLATHLGASDGLVALHDAGNHLFQGFGTLISLVSVTALVATMGLNAYSGMLTAVTAIDSLRKITPTRSIRIITILLLAVVWLFISLTIKGHAIDTLFSVLTLMLYLLVPWTAVNLVDYFLVRKGKYAITHLFRNDGIYGSWGKNGIAAYLAGFAVSIPFFVLPGIYTGPMAKLMGGVDIAWLIGLLASSLVYLLASRSINLKHEHQAIRHSEQELKTISAADHTSESAAVPFGVSL
jgi:NCS1 family nucleobase:cation symporter-1